MEVTQVVFYGSIAVVVLVFLLRLLSSDKDFHLSSKSFWWNGEVKITSRKDSNSKNIQYGQCPHCNQSVKPSRLENHVKNKCTARKR